MGTLLDRPDPLADTREILFSPPPATLSPWSARLAGGCIRPWTFDLEIPQGNEWTEIEHLDGRDLGARVWPEAASVLAPIQNALNGPPPGRFDGP